MTIESIKQKYDIIGNDPQLNEAINKANQVAPTDLSILITGESGVGKDVFSKIVHNNSLRKGKNLVPVNCGAIPEGTIESELFGHMKGSFTGAEKDSKGFFGEADGGTIFLDEVGELPLSMQVKLLRVLENGEITPVGASKPRKVDVRVVAATNVDLLNAVRQGRFRYDLYYRLNQISIHIPPLRERRNDIYLLFCKFSSDVAERYRMNPIILDHEAREYLCQYPWYGNIRELKNITEQIALLEPTRNIDRTILRHYLTPVADEKMPVIYSGSMGSDHNISDRELLLKALSMGQMINEMRTEINNLKSIITSLAQGNRPNISDPAFQTAPATSYITPTQDIPQIHVDVPLQYDDEYQDSVEVFDDPREDEGSESLNMSVREREAIVKALKLNKGNRRLAAEALGFSQRTLYRKIKDYDITE